MTLAEHAGIFTSVVEGSISPQAVQSAFERLVRDRIHVVAELQKLTVKELEAVARPHYRGEKKARLVDMAYDVKLNDYGFLTVENGVLSISGFTHEDRVAGIRVRLAQLQESHLARYRENAIASREKRAQQVAYYKKALENPETVDEFKVFIKFNGEEKLSTEQRARYDALVTGHLRAKRESEGTANAVIQGVSSQADMALVQTKHTREHYDLFVVQLNRRVDASQFKELSTAAKRLNGWYSSYGRGGAIPGFQFKSKDAAEQFMTVGRGESVDTSESVAERKQLAKETAGGRLLVMADRIEAVASARLSATRKTNTARRARMASSAEASARADIALAKTMRNIAQAISDGSATHLDGLRERGQVEELISMLRSAKAAELSAAALAYSEWENRKDEPATEATVAFVTYPRYLAHADLLRNVIRNLDGIQGTIRLTERLRVLSNEAARKDRAIEVQDELVDALFAKLDQRAETLMPHTWVSSRDTRKRLARMGIESGEQLRMAIREFLRYRENKEGANRAVELERALIGQRIGIDFFPTPKLLAERMVGLAGVTQGVRILEPSAGNGNIAEAVRKAGVEPDVAEISSQLREILLAKGFNVVGWDFMDVTDRYDVIIQNPPFSNDIQHVRHAYSLLQDGGKLVSIVGEGAFIRQGKAETEFRSWLNEIAVEIEELPQGTFHDSSLMVTTGANARLITVTK
ncbi:hypothetical protein RY831_14975 [Noviherbaspirillum sp. CPCC 100848]|uniref:Methyltransferase small domain-containing protein n=1 Tax=Noviherbaspirillum album TaxID=3080276 RepID=A0ABU6JAA3_9BURK|nr:hypothetical protein [Noviherbaspirillum sp. CPCC 100848]MEC4720463.1 hypothetical protein [Noviherbaspirillum sp. CPCC 100848]